MQCAIPQKVSAIPSQRVTLFSATQDTATMAIQLFQLSNHKLRKEASQTEPKLGRLLGHISVYDATRVAARESVHTKQKLGSSSIEDDIGVGEVFSYTIENTSASSSEQQVSPEDNQYTSSTKRSPLQDFKAALEEQLQLIQNMSCNKTFNSDPFSDDEQYEDCDDSDSSDTTAHDEDGWEADDSDNESDDSLTDTEIMDAEIIPPEELENWTDWSCEKFADFEIGECSDDEAPSIQPLVVHFGRA